MTEQIFRELQVLYDRRRKNEQAVAPELLQTKYKKSWDALNEQIKEAQCRLRTEYVKRIRAVSTLVAESVYMDFGTEKGRQTLLDRNAEIYAEYHDPFMKELLAGFLKALEEMGE